MLNGMKPLSRSLRWGMVGGGGTSQIGYSHRCAALRDNVFTLLAGALDIDAERGRRVYGDGGEGLVDLDGDERRSIHPRLVERRANRVGGLSVQRHIRSGHECVTHDARETVDAVTLRPFG